MKDPRVHFNGKSITFYEFFGVEEKASPDDLKKSYRALCLKYHPDKNNGSEASEKIFKAIQVVWSVLNDANKRSEYDRRLAIEKGVVQESGVYMHFTVQNFYSTNSTTGFTWGFGGETA